MENKKINLIVKLYKQEIFWFTQVFPKFQTFLQDKVTVQAFDYSTNFTKWQTYHQRFSKCSSKIWQEIDFRDPWVDDAFGYGKEKEEKEEK